MSWIICPDEKNGLLDLYPGAAAAYSLRNLTGRSGASSPVVRVRRSSDNTEQDFTAAQITDGTLTAFCGGGDGFVRTWYDQSGNSNHAQQTTVSRQPRIVSSGNLEASNAKPALYTNLNADENFGLRADIAGFSTFTNLSVFSQVTPINGTSADTFNNLGLFQFGNPASNGLLITDATGLLSGETVAINFNDNTSRRLGSSTYARNANTQSLFSSFHLAAGSSIYANGNQITLNLANGMTALTPAAPANTGYTSDNFVSLASNSSIGRPTRIQEFIFYPSNQSANRTAIEANINAHYSIF